VSDKGRKIIVARNCHASVYNAIELNELVPVFIYPELIEKEDIISGISGSIRKESLEKLIINNPDACAVIITSPTYDGVLSDVSSIARLAHEYDMPLIVDEAHGALFFIEGRSAVINGADIVINSIHKTLPSLTQTALIHVNGKLIDKKKLRKYLRFFQTSSPSYILMGSMDYAVEIMENSGNRLYRDFCIRTLRLKDGLRKLRNIRYVDKDFILINGAYDFDESKVLISSASLGMTGKELYNTLITEYGIQPEMAAGDYVLLMTTLFDTDEGIDLLLNALYEIDNCNNKEILKASEGSDSKDVSEEYDEQFENSLSNFRALKAMINDYSNMTVYAYPPGIPIIVAGEIVTEDIVSEIERAVIGKLDIKWIEQ